MSLGLICVKSLGIPAYGHDLDETEPDQLLEEIRRLRLQTLNLEFDVADTLLIRRESPRPFRCRQSGRT